MSVTVRVPGPLRRLTEGAAEVTVEGATVAAVLADLEARYPGFHDRLYDGEGRLRQFINLYLNDADIRFGSGLDSAVKQDDSLSIVPAVAGGNLPPVVQPDLTAVDAVIAPDPLDDLPADAVVAVAMSGGVDSSVAAARCAVRGLRVIGITLAMWPRTRSVERDRGCCSVDAVEDARRVAGQLGVPHYAWNLEDEFRDRVIAGFEQAYAAGLTPNPCVGCNQQIKFGALLERARAAGATHVATGHHARLGRRGRAVTLHRSLDRAKDQAYTLHRLDQAQLHCAVLPLAPFVSKAEVRAEAERLGLVTAAKPDSQELCFVEGSLSEELGRRLAGRFAPGRIRDQDGQVIGEHRGLPFYTVGQRSGLALQPGAPDVAPRFVVALDPENNELRVGSRQDLERLSAVAVDCRWVAGEPPAVGTRCDAQLRAHGLPLPARVRAAGGDRVELEFETPASQVAPGQALVLYRGDEVLGGGVLDRAALATGADGGAH